MSTIPQLPSGMRDFLNESAKRRLKLIHTISEVYQSFGFYPLETPAFERLSLLLGQGGQENEKLIFKILRQGRNLEAALEDRNEEKLSEYGLRFDLTLPLSRAVALHRNEIRFPWKVFHIGPVWRGERAQKGRFREFHQCDVDVIGGKGKGVEIEVLQAGIEALHRVGAKGFELRINDRRLIEKMALAFGFGQEKLNSFAILLDKKDKLDRETLLSEMKLLLEGELPTELVSLVDEKLTLSSATTFHEEAGTHLKEIIDSLKALNLPLTSITYDPSLVRGMGYYTGAVFELRHASAGYSFGGGGRYDELIGRLGGTSTPACGFSIGFERLALLLEEQEQEAKLEPRLLFIPVFKETLRTSILKVAQSLRKAQIHVDVYPDEAKVKNQFKFASDSSYRYVLIIGEAEWETQRFKIKDFYEGNETEVAAQDLITHVKKLFPPCH